MIKLAMVLLGVVAAAIAAASPAPAQSYPDRPIKIVVAYPPGGPTDTIARVATQGLSERLGQSVIIENLAGAGGRIGTRAVARAAPDGYTLLVGGTNDNAITPVIYQNLDYDPAKDFAPVAALATDSNAIVVNPALPAHTLAELADYAKANPGKVTSGATQGIAPHLLLEFFRARSGADMVFVPYKGAAPAIADLLGNQIQVNASAKSVLLPLIQAGKLRALAVSSDERWPELPDVPTLHEAGIDGFPSALWFTLMAPAATPPAVIATLNEAVNAQLLSRASRDAIAKIGLATHVLSPDALAGKIAEEVKLWQAVARESGVHLE
jgi:tripartite-type tricarboxylate transporter receptor subunit TctC